MKINTTYVHESELRKLARDAYEHAKREHGLTQQQIAEKLNVRQGTISQALREDADRPFASLLIGIIEYCAGYKLIGCYYRVKRVEN